MADVNINKFRASVVRDGSKPASPGFIVSEGQDPVNPPGTNNYVPYSGATANVELGEYGVEAGFITLDTTPTNTPTDQGTIFWDADDETVDIVLNGYTMKIGEDLFYPVKNQTGSTIAKGVAVRFNGTVGASGRLLIAPFIADGSVPSSRFMGVTAEEILNGEDGKVLYFGRVRGINTNAFNEGDILYASTTVAGGYQTAIPVAPNNIVQVAAVVTKSATVGTIFVRPTLGSNINKDEGVKITSVADKNLLQYQSGTSLWENKSLAQVLGGTSAQFVKGDGSLDSTTYGTGTVTSVGLSSATSGVTIGSTPVTTSGTITLAIATASGSQNGLLSSTDWTIFNNKQNALTNPVTGTGTTNYLPKFTGSTTIGDSNLINDASGNLGLGLTPNTWTGTGTKAFQFQNGTLSASNTYGTSLTWNAYFNAGDKYITNGVAGRYLIEGNVHRWDTAPSGTAGNAISFTQAMTLTSGGNLILTTGTVTDNGARLQVTNGNGISFSSRSGASNLFTYAAFGRTSDELAIGIAGATDQFFTGSVAGDAVIKSLGTNNSILLGYGTSTALKIASTGAANFSNSLRIQGSTVPTSGSGTELAWDGTNGYLLAYNRTSSAYLPLFVQGSSLNFGTGDGTTRLTITSGGNVGIGTTSPVSFGSTNTVLSVNNVNGGGGGGVFVCMSDGNQGLRMAVDSASSALWEPRNVYFRIATNNTERMRITSSGNVLIGTTTDNGARLQVSGGDLTIANNTTTALRLNPVSNSFQATIYLQEGGATRWEFGKLPSTPNFYIYSYGTSSEVFRLNYSSGAAYFSSLGTGTVYSNGGTLTNTNPSDLNLKENIAPINYGLSEILKLNAVTFNWKNDTINQGKQYGFIAQEVQKIMPDLVKKGDYLGLDKEAIFTTLVKAIQELKQEIDTLKN